MAARPLPGAVYHTADFAFHSSPDVDPEAVHSSPSEKEPSTLEIPLQTSQGRTRPCRGQLVLLIVLLLCCLAFAVSAFRGGATDDQNGKDPYETLAQKIEEMFQSAPHKELLHERFEGAVDMFLKQKYNSSCVGCHATHLRDYMRQSYPVVHSSLQWTDVSHSAIVLHWQGVDRKSKPVLIGNNKEALDVDGCYTMSSDLDFQIVDVGSAVVILTAIESLIQSGYQPSRTIVSTFMFREAGNAQEVNHYLHSTYDERGLEMGSTTPQIPQCKGLCALRRLFDGLHWTARRYLPDILYWPTIDPASPSLETYQCHDGRDDETYMAKYHAAIIGEWSLIISHLGTDYDYER